MVYVLNALEYDKYISNEEDKEKVNEFAKEFYTDGFLFGSLEMKSALCGNYASLFTALCKRVGLQSYLLCNKYHAWNMVQIDDINYYTDPTFLDNETFSIVYDGIFSNVCEVVPSDFVIENDLSDYLNWYLEDPSLYVDKNSNDFYHIAKNLPSYVELSSISDLNNNDGYIIKKVVSSTDKKFIGTSAILFSMILMELVYIIKYKSRTRNSNDDCSYDNVKKLIKKYDNK